METIEVHTDFDQMSRNWHADMDINQVFIRSVQAHMNNLLAARGHVLLNEVYDALGMDRTPLGAVAGWLFENPVPITINVVDRRANGAVVLDIPDSEFILGRF